MTEDQAIIALEKLAKKWPETLWLFAASGNLHVMKKDDNADVVMRADGVDPDYVLATIDIECDGGDW